MFGSSKKTKETGRTSAIIPSSSGHSLNSLVEGTSVEGTIKSKSDIRIDGSIKGDLTCDAKVIIGPTGFIDGTIKCQNAVIEGRFMGILTVSELLNIRESANVSGEVSYGKLIVQSGAVIDGSYKKHGKSNGSTNSSKLAKDLAKSGKNTQNIANKLKKETVN